MPTAGPVSWRRRVHQILESGIGHEPIATAVSLFVIVLIVANVVAFVAETVPELEQRYRYWFAVFEIFSVAVFAIEYGLRVWAAVEMPFLGSGNPWKARLRYAMQPMQIIDFMAFAPALLSWLLPIDLAFLRVLRLFRFLKLLRFSPAMNLLGRVLSQERSALAGTLLILLSLIVFAATGMYYIERHAQPDKLGTIPDAMWWAVVTLCTVGYGDVYPITPLGKAFGGVMIMLGLGAFALPIGILATGFNQETARREFAVTWSLVARVPLFADLDAAAVSQVMTLLYSQTFDVGDAIVRRGDPGSTMYFIASGEVLVEGEGADVKIGEGDFFGEIALFEHRPRSHTVVALCRTRCLLLDRDDLERLGRRHPEIMRRVREVAKQRMKPQE
jgi:voltage-gated potassium channel